MDRYLKLSLLLLCGFVGIEASQYMPGINPQKPTFHSRPSYGAFQRAQAAQLLSNHRFFKIVAGIGIGIQAFSSINQYRQTNNSDKTVKIAETGQTMTKEQNNRTNKNSDQQLELSRMSAYTQAGSAMAGAPGAATGFAMALDENEAARNLRDGTQTAAFKPQPVKRSAKFYLGTTAGSVAISTLFWGPVGGATALVTAVCMHRMEYNDNQARTDVIKKD